MTTNLYCHFQSRLHTLGATPFLVTADGQSYIGHQIDQRAARMAGCLAALGAQAGDRVTVQVEKSVEALCLYLACLRAGLVYQPLNPAYTVHELDYFIGDAEPIAVVCDPARVDAIRQSGASAGVQKIFTLDADGQGSLSRAADDADGDGVVVARGGDDLAALLYSSGTTGVPKGIRLTHTNLLSNVQTLVDAWGFSEQDRLLHALPLFHVHGLFVALGCALLSGARVCWLNRFDPQQVTRLLPQCTVFMGVPTYYVRLLADPAFDADAARNMRLFVSGSAPLLEETFFEFERRTGYRILERYGMSETGMNTSNPLQGLRKPGTVGPPLAGVVVRICDDHGQPVPAGQIGNLQVRGPNVFDGYWNLPDKTAEAFTDDGFFETGDKGLIDEDGYVSIVGRAKDLVITGGLNVYPKEVEGVIDELVGVVESAVIGVPHTDFGEGIVAVVVAQPDKALSEADVVTACRQKLAAFKAPKRVAFVDHLPRNAMGKVQKNQLRERYRDTFDAADGP